MTVCYTMVMAKQNVKQKQVPKKTKKQENQELDGAFVLKLVVLVILGSLWIRFKHGGAGLHVPIPIGLIIGMLLTTNEMFRIDRKIEYAVLISATLFGLTAPYGILVNL